MSAMDNSAPGSRPTPTLVVEGVSFGYGQLRIVDSASLQVGQGEIVVLIGPNGAGKSTLVKGIIGQLPLLEGKLTLNGTDLSRTSPQARIRHGVGYVPQLRDVFPTLSVVENLEMGGYILSGESVRARIEEVMEIFPALAAMRHRKAGSLSGGERKMLAIGRALMAEPSVLILDEPTSNLAPNVAARVINEVVTDLVSSGQAVLDDRAAGRDGARGGNLGLRARPGADAHGRRCLDLARGLGSRRFVLLWRNDDSPRRQLVDLVRLREFADESLH